MKLYLIRHGESIANASSVIQPVGSELSEKGKEQARFLAKRFQGIPVDIILSSPLARTKQTAEAIQKEIGKEIVYSDLLAERKQPSELIGKPTEDSEAQRAFNLWREHAGDPAWHYSDEENFSEVRARARRFLEFLSQRNEEHILCVTHGVFLRTLVGLMGFGEQFTPQVFLVLRGFLRTKNTGITVCEQDAEGEWHMETWNDHAHLG
ncbi:MAG: histidine phosphatase family protein [Candidatus Yanofskybacteria bacterium]|nr:histidine phosphatase family protein [Candidatus Yanofskybacteria bacterium]